MRLIAQLLQRAGLPAIAERAAPALLEAAIAEDVERLDALAAETGADAALFATVGALAAMPVLHACRRAWQARVPADWMCASCAICGAWATLAEARGLERRLCLRCGRCGAEWGAQIVRCAFCGTTDHDRLGTLVSGKGGTTRTVETCANCLAYMKTVTMLTACPPEDVRLLDLATVDLDIAALAHGYARPTHVAQRLDTHVTARVRRRLFTRWRT
jgi:FdhE protein